MIRLRDGGEAEAERLFELDQVCFDEGIAYSLREFRSLLRSSKTLCILAEEDASLAGFVIAQGTIVRKSRGGHIVTIDVPSGFRRRGVGRLLMKQIEERLRAGAADWLRLEVAVNNSAALEFYRELGFAPIGRISNYYQDSIDAIVMEKALNTGDQPTAPH